MFDKEKVPASYRLLTMLSCLLFTFSAHAYPESLSRIKEVVKSFLNQQIHVPDNETVTMTVEGLQEPLKVHACASELTTALPSNNLNDQITTVEVSCADKNTWHLYVPVQVIRKIAVLAAKHAIPANEAITEADIDYIFQNKNNLYNGFYSDKKEVLGYSSNYMIPAGSILTKRNIQAPLLIHRNQTLNMIAEKNGILITMQGIAKSDGALHAMIKVFNPSSKRIIDAEVVGPNKVKALI